MKTEKTVCLTTAHSAVDMSPLMTKRVFPEISKSKKKLLPEELGALKAHLKE